MNIKTRFDKNATKNAVAEGESKVQQQFKDQSDINNIVKRFKRTGSLQSMPTMAGAQRRPVFGAYNHMDYAEMYEHIQQVKQQFLSLPAKLRARFDNNPANVVRFVSDPANLSESLKLGLCHLPDGYMLDGNRIVEQIDLEAESKKSESKSN